MTNDKATIDRQKRVESFPKTIWLSDGDSDEGDLFPSGYAGEAATWCDEKQEAHDVQYVRADEIDRQAKQIAMLRDVLEEVLRSDTEQSCDEAYTALSVTEADVSQWEKQCRDAVYDSLARHFEAKGDGCEMFATTVAFEIETLKDTKP